MEPKKELSWRQHQHHGAIMKPKTFHQIEMKAVKSYGIDKQRAAKVAGHAYWQTVRAKYKAR